MADFQFTLTQVMQATNAVLKKITSASIFGGVTTDTRKVEEGMLFVALKGEKFDGHDFIAEAAKKGAIGAIVNKDYDVSRLEDVEIDILAVNDTLKAYQDLAKLWRSKFSIPVIGITGSNGKTTTKDLTAAVLSGKWNVLKTQANFNNEIGLPMTLLQLNKSYDVAVVEMGMRGLGQIKLLTDIAKPTIGVITNVGETHMELLGSIENIAKAKSEMAQAIEIDGKVVLNADDEHVAKMHEVTKARPIYFGINHAADVKAFNVKTVGEGKTEFDAFIGENMAHFTLNMLGIHNVYNCLAALAVGYACGLTIEEMQKGLASFKPTAMRFEYKKVGDFNVINDAYNASPMSTKAALSNLAKVTDGRKILVMGDMFELGSVEVKAHEDIAVQAKEAGVSIIVTRGTLTQNTARKAREIGIPEVYECANHEEAVATLKKVLQKDDTVLFKGSHGMHMEKIIELLENEYK
ncbi:UDP-N-acetylmuramoyl-tripeptide--D-alanyl-D-alanine ligase [Megamonas hypermegale]|uniref:UDP-N-acetylmuramoyl-tripeptide--D-alanyl-D- alanine ligase n=1 Tax=Megamonas hypermegale TaxID=158847 RepID=UPI000B3AB834|nr:UDP-N-acetylmuramoyl-tripeptide--D-alanyl-D-alanine ligase [Megamonas hypermegale]OUO41414.1 UDP-N-acetylmuramoyl-tripeptide--D-alanyl-D-alanine ligase [Megamonas hypermegale]HJG07971.1 UDP-N-acetylmuramoyl-tripeptide--D-alanyl-D-alanine ligase [Megamonas hypermegale]